MSMPVTIENVQPLPAGQQARLYPLAGLRAGTLQPRKRFGQAALQELSESIKRQGVVQPIVIRPIEISPDVFALEIVCGERRWRASQLAGKTHIPAIERELNDVEALELAVIENAQRQDLHPIEEAEGYKALLHAYGHDDANKQTADDLATKIGKSRTYIYNRIKLLDLVPDAQDKFYDGVLPTSLAEKIARMPMAQQPLALADVIKDGVCLPVREAEALLRRKYMLRLNAAPFSTKATTLVSEAGSCLKCHKRTGAEPDLFADVEHNDTCTDPPCYQRKVAAHQAQVKAKAEKAGMQVIEGDNARALLKFGTTSDQLNGDYVYMDQPLKHLTDSTKSLADLLGTNLKASALFEHPKDLTLRHIVLVTKAIAALRAADLLVHDPEAEKRTKKAAQQQLDTTVATPREQPAPAINSRVVESAGAAGLAQQQAGGADTTSTGTEMWDGPTATDEEVKHEWAWREAAVTSIHNTLHDYGYMPTDIFRRMVVRRLAETLAAPALALLARLWGWEGEGEKEGSPHHVVIAAQSMDGNQLDILIAELLVLKDVHVAAWALKTPACDVTRSDLVKACEDEDINIDWRTLAGATEGQQGPTPAQEDHYQAPQGAQHDEPAQPSPAHWIGQFVQIKGAKGTWSITSIEDNGDIHVREQVGAMRGTRRIAAHEAKVLPGQVCPAHQERREGNWVGQKVAIKGTKRCGEVSELLPNGMVLVAVPVKGQDHASLEGFAPSQLESDKAQPLPHRLKPGLSPEDAWPFPTRPNN